MRTRTIIATTILATLATVTGAEARSRVVHVHADTVVIQSRDASSFATPARVVSLPREGVVVDRKITASKRPTRAALIACQMGPNFLGEAWRGKRYRPFTRTGRPRICMTG